MATPPPEVHNKLDSTSTSKSSDHATIRSNERISVPQKPPPTVMKPSFAMAPVNRSIMLGNPSMYSGRSMSMVREEGSHLTTNAYDRLMAMNRSNDVDFGLPEVPGPGTYGMEPKKASNPAARMNAAKFKCIVFSTLAVLLIFMELLFIITTNDCEQRATLSKTVAGLAILIIILEWVRAWLLQETSPMMVSKLYRSTVHDTNTDMEVALIYVEPPQQEETSPNSLYTKSPETAPRSQIPRLVMKEPTYGEVPYEYAEGAAAVLGVLKGKSQKGGEDKCSNTVTYPMINLGLAAIRILIFIASPMFRGICALCAGQPVEETPLVVKTQNTEFINELTNPPVAQKKYSSQQRKGTSTEEL
ncbi:unnamed protein product [Dibothriocephalus latus]|uniref:Uncharacterized protein n=1 Tax=Dibothriocephalus latus TaxID=60516 RepID=A0A3P7PCZ7_DIBLA|nr:unnamed protein product [Dibothriocephalus latus]